MNSTEIPVSEIFEKSHVDIGAAAFDNQAKLKNQSVVRKSRKDAKFTARLNQDDFDGLKQLALEKGMLYQSLLGHIIHLYVQRKLVDITEMQKLFELKKIG